MSCLFQLVGKNKQNLSEHDACFIACRAWKVQKCEINTENYPCKRCEHLRKLVSGSHAWGGGNILKTKYVIFGPKHKLQNMDAPLYINNEKLEKTNKMKYLGVILDEELNFNDHINYIHTKATNKLGILRKSRDFLDRKTSLLLYQSLVLPHFDYCDTTYSCTTQANLNKLQLIQNSACRTVLRCSKREPRDNMHKELGLLKLNERRELHLSMDCHKAVHTNNSMTRYFNVGAARTTRSGETRILIPNYKTNMGRRAFSFRGPNHWDKLPAQLKCKTTPDSFKSEYKKLFCRYENHPT